MIKLPEPFRKQGQQLCNDGNTTVFFDAYNKDQLKQAVRDFGEQCAQACAAEAEGRGDEDAFVAKLCAAAIRALIKEIPT